jgi:hypothetical protein
VTSAACSGTRLTRSTQTHGCAFLVGKGILRPLGNSTNRRTNCPALSTTYLVPSGNRFGRRYALRTFGPHFVSWVPPTDTLCRDRDGIVAIPSRTRPDPLYAVGAAPFNDGHAVFLVKRVGRSTFEPVPG